MPRVLETDEMVVGVKTFIPALYKASEYKTPHALYVAMLRASRQIDKRLVYACVDGYVSTDLRVALQFARFFKVPLSKVIELPAGS